MRATRGRSDDNQLSGCLNRSNPLGRDRAKLFVGVIIADRRVARHGITAAAPHCAELVEIARHSCLRHRKTLGPKRRDEFVLAAATNIVEQLRQRMAATGLNIIH